MKKIILYFIFFVLLAGLGYVYYKGISSIENENHKIQASNQNFKKVKNYLEEKYKGNYPIPEGNLILLDKKGEMIHLEDRNTPLSKIKNLYVIQGTTCDILKDDKKFNSFNYDTKYSITENNKDTGKVLVKKCFSYAVTKDKKSFQIGLVENNKAILDGNISKSITKAYNAPVLVKNNDTNFLPYAPYKVSPIVQVSNLGNSNITLTVSDDENTYNVKLKNGDNVVLTGDVNGIYQIAIKGRLDKKTLVKFIDTNGSITYIQGDDNGYVDFKINDYKIDTNRIDYIVETGKFLANVVKLSPDTNMTVSKKGTTLVIRGTKFSIDSEKDTISTYLVLGKIQQKNKDGKELTLDILNSFVSIVNNKIVPNLKKLEQLASFIVYNDIITHPKYSYKIYKNDYLTDVLSGTKNVLTIKYENGEIISLISFKRSKLEQLLNSNKIDISSCNGKRGCIELKKYENLINNFCKKNRYRSGLDVSKMYYLLDFTGSLSSFRLKDKIKSELNLDNYVLFTSRYGGYGGSKNVSSLVSYLYDGGIKDVSIKRLVMDGTRTDIKNIVVACEY